MFIIGNRDKEIKFHRRNRGCRIHVLQRSSTNSSHLVRINVLEQVVSFSLNIIFLRFLGLVWFLCLMVIQWYIINGYLMPKPSMEKNSTNIHHHHRVVPLAQISLTLSRHFSLSFIAFGRSSGLHPVSSHSCCMYLRAGRPAFAWPYAGVNRSTSLMSSSLLLQQCPACLVRLTWIVFVMGEVAV